MESLLTADAADVKLKSIFAARLGYNSNIVAENSAFNISKFGLAPGISYYHKSGLYADFTAYWSKEYEPNFYLSVASLGYIQTVSKWYSIIGEYSHFFYSQSDSEIYAPYTESIGLTNYFEFKPVVLRLDYYLYFGQKTAHRIMPSLGVNLIKKNWLGFNRISVYPNFNVLFGSEEVTQEKAYPRPVLRYLYNTSHPNDPQLPYTYFETTNEFGLMNYSFSLPVSLTKNNWNFMLSYNYNIPRSLTNEDTSLQDGGYLSFSITRYFSFR